MTGSLRYSKTPLAIDVLERGTWIGVVCQKDAWALRLGIRVIPRDSERAKASQHSDQPTTQVMQNVIRLYL